MKDLNDYLGDDSEYRSAIIDTAVNYGLVTDYTSMVVMRDEQFDARNIERKNRERRITETTAGSARDSQPVRNTRVDQSSPAFNAPRASHSGGSGGGSIGLGLAMLILLLVPQLLKRRKTARG